MENFGCGKTLAGIKNYIYVFLCVFFPYIKMVIWGMVYWVYHVIGQNWVPLCDLQHGFWGYPIIRLTRGAHRRTSANASPHGGMRCAIARKPPGMEAKDIRRINRLFQRVYTGGNQWSPNNGHIYIYIIYIHIYIYYIYTYIYTYGIIY